MGSGQECRPHHCCLSRRHGDRRQALAGSTRILLGRTTGVSVSRIGPTFDDLARQGRRALIMYLTVGYPERESALELVPAIVEAGADMIELGVPFSDPLADGATVQRATQIALVNGVNVGYCLRTVRDLRM